MTVTFRIEDGEGTSIQAKVTKHNELLVNDNSTRISIGSIQVNLNNLDDTLFLEADTDGTSTGDFVTFDDFIVDDARTLFSRITALASEKDAYFFGYADDALGTNFVELLGKKVVAPKKDEINIIEILFTIPVGKFPIIKLNKNVLTGFVTLEGISSTNGI